MKKLKLKALELGARELLSREQLRNVFGGSDDGSNDEPGGSDDCGEPQQSACDNKNMDGTCCYVSQGNIYYGRCLWVPTNPKMICSSLT